jgi:hypothetical protein
MTPYIRQYIAKDPLQASIFCTVLALHACFLLYFCVENWIHPTVSPQRQQHFVVTTIELGSPKPAQQEKRQARVEAVPQPAVAEPEEAVKEVKEIKKESSKPKEKKENKPAVEKAVSEPKKSSEPKKVESTKAEKKEAPKKAESKVKEEPKPKEEAKPKEQKKSTTTKEKPAKAATSTKASSSSKQENKQKEAMLKAAQESLAKIDHQPKSLVTVAPALPTLKTVGQLQIDALPGSSNQKQSSQEMGYVDELVGRLKLQLKLPEYGDVKTRLTLDRRGHVVQIVIVSSESSANRSYIEKQLPALSFPAFGNNFDQETQHTFQITLRNDL